jgi:hypothetical protein
MAALSWRTDPTTNDEGRKTKAEATPTFVFRRSSFVSSRRH